MLRATLILVSAVLLSLPAVFTISAAQVEGENHGAMTLNVYALDTCPVSGMKLGSMGDPVVRSYDGREVRFCCAGCLPAFEKDRAGFFEKIDAALADRQRPHYALDVCIVSGRSLADAENPPELIHEGRLVRFCCPGCPPRFKADPTRFMPKLDEAVIAQQRDRYPLNTCVVSGQKLGSMGDPIERIIGGTLVRLCCDGCIDRLKNDPAKHMSQIREAG